MDDELAAPAPTVAVMAQNAATTNDAPAHAPLARVSDHFRKVPAAEARRDVATELAQARLKDNALSMTMLPRAAIDHVSQYYPLFRNPAELRAIPERLSGDNEFGFCPAFMPELVDATAQLGLFPMALDLGRGTMVFAAKCHRQRAFTPILSPATDGKNTSAAAAKAAKSAVKAPADAASSTDQQPLAVAFDFSGVAVPRRLSRRCTVRVHVQSQSSSSSPDGGAATAAVPQALLDLQASLVMIHKQHGENWLCRPLRDAMQFMLTHPTRFRTTFVVLVVEEQATKEIVACETGYIVGDVYTSYTGAYAVSGAGTLSLALTAKLLALLGLPLWDLGMTMDYKQRALACRTMGRRRWLEHVAARVAAEQKRCPPSEQCQSPFLCDTARHPLLARLAAGVPADVMLAASTPLDLAPRNVSAPSVQAVHTAQATSTTEAQIGESADTTSKNQRKKEAKKAQRLARKAQPPLDTSTETQDATVTATANEK